MFPAIIILFSTVFPSFDAARAQTAKDGKPLLVVVSGTWCAPCKQLKSEVIEPMIKSGELDDVNYSVVLVDKEDRDIVNNLVLSGHTSIPQTIFYFKKDNQWYKSGLVGMHSNPGVMKERIRGLIKLGNKNE